MFITEHLMNLFPRSLAGRAGGFEIKFSYPQNRVTHPCSLLPPYHTGGGTIRVMPQLPETHPGNFVHVNSDHGFNWQPSLMTPDN